VASRFHVRRAEAINGVAQSLRIADLIFEAGSPRSVWFGPLVRTQAHIEEEIDGHRSY